MKIPYGPPYGLSANSFPTVTLRTLAAAIAASRVGLTARNEQTNAPRSARGKDKPMSPRKGISIAITVALLVAKQCGAQAVGPLSPFLQGSF
jgi:hypothetical protein